MFNFLKKHLFKERLDTSKIGLEHIGIKLTDEQYALLIFLEGQQREFPKDSIFNTIVLLKILNLIPKECELPEDEKPLDLETVLGKRYLNNYRSY